MTAYVSDADLLQRNHNTTHGKDILWTPVFVVVVVVVCSELMYISSIEVFLFKTAL